MKRIITAICLLLLVSQLLAKTDKKNTLLVSFQTVVNGQPQQDRNRLMLKCNANASASWSETAGNLLPVVAKESSYIDFVSQKTWQVANFADGRSINTTSPFSEYPQLTVTSEKETILGYACTKATTSLRSNSIEIWFTTEAGAKGTPSMAYGIAEGLVLKIVRNGNFELRATEIKALKESNQQPIIPESVGETVELPLYRHLITEQLITTVDIFTDEQISFGNEINNPQEGLENVTYRYSSGTVILKKVKLPAVPDDTQLFAELYQYSNGDAYDRTGTIFMVPVGKEKSFLDGLRNGVDKLPVFNARNGKSYQGVTTMPYFDPLVEIIRFFTPFGINQFNDKVNVYGLKWQDSTYYKQEVSDLLPLLQGECWIGAFIGNYDKGGHKVSLRFKYYPGSRDVSDKPAKKYWVQPVFNTLNVMEMTGQEYGTMFGTDSLKATISVPKGVNNLIFRYISTGHGGWGNGDEFNQKLNTVLLDEKILFEYTPWRCDCATWRNLNPASGNFWNGTTSSDYSRSGWCPGTATQPVYYPVRPLNEGEHQIKVSIPLGQNEGGSFSSWNVSGLLIGEFEK